MRSIGLHYIASELIEGETLRQRLMRGPMQLSEAVNVAIQVASALAAAHETGIVHRDIKPENIMLRPDGYVKVLDFGIAKLAESAFADPSSVAVLRRVEATADGAESTTLAETNLGSILGTVRYMSPEQAHGAPVDQGTDIWSLGVVLYEMITGHAPFTKETPRETMLSVLRRRNHRCSRVTSHESRMSFSRLSTKRCAKIVRNGITAHANRLRRSKVSGVEWNSRLSWDAPHRLVPGCAGQQ